jgi:voltage-dependent anion channel protein 2
LVDTEKNTAVGVEVARNFSTKANRVTFGMRHALDPTTTVKARYSSNGMASALIQHEWRPKSFCTLSTEVDVNRFDFLQTPKFGLSLVLKP